MVKSSEVLRLAAEYEFEGEDEALIKATNRLKFFENRNGPPFIRQYYVRTGYMATIPWSEHAL